MVGVCLGWDILRVFSVVTVPVNFEFGYPVSTESEQRSTRSLIPWISGEDVPLKFVHLRRRGVGLLQLWLGVVVTDVVPNTDKLRCAVAAGQQDDRHANKVGLGDLLGVGRVSLQNRVIDQYHD